MPVEVLETRTNRADGLIRHDPVGCRAGRVARCILSRSSAKRGQQQYVDSHGKPAGDRRHRVRG